MTSHEGGSSEPCMGLIWDMGQLLTAGPHDSICKCTQVTPNAACILSCFCQCWYNPICSEKDCDDDFAFTWSQSSIDTVHLHWSCVDNVVATFNVDVTVTPGPTRTKRLGLATGTWVGLISALATAKANAPPVLSANFFL